MSREAGPEPRAGGAARMWVLTGLAALAPLSWGTTYLVTTEFLPPERPLLSGVLRALPAGLLLVLFTRTLPRGTWWWRAAVLGTLNIGAFFALLFLAAYRLPGGVAAILNSAQPLIVVALALVLLGERPTSWRLGWAVAGVAGVALMVLRGQLVLDAVGIVAGLGGAAAMASGVVLSKRWGRPAGVGVAAYTGWLLTAGGLVLLPVAWIVEGSPPAIDLAALGGYAYLSVIGTLLAYLVWFHGLSKLPVAGVSFLGLLSPMMATALGWIVLDEVLSPLQVAGFALALLATAASQLTPESVRALQRPRPQNLHAEPENTPESIAIRDAARQQH